MSKLLNWGVFAGVLSIAFAGAVMADDAVYEKFQVTLKF